MISAGFWASIQSADDLVSQTSKVRILHSAKENNLSHFDAKIACLCRSIKINNNKHMYHQSQLRKTTGNEVMWVECSLIIGTDYRFRLLLDSSVGLWVSRRHSVCWRVGVSMNFFLILNLIWVCLRWRQFSPLPSLQFMGLRVIKHWGRDKWPPFSRRHFQTHFRECNCMNFASLKFVPKGPLNIIPALVQIMFHYLKQCWLVLWRINASPSLNELTTLHETMEWAVCFIMFLWICLCLQVINVPFHIYIYIYVDINLSTYREELSRGIVSKYRIVTAEDVHVASWGGASIQTILVSKASMTLKIQLIFEHYLTTLMPHFHCNFKILHHNIIS